MGETKRTPMAADSFKSMSDECLSNLLIIAMLIWRRLIRVLASSKPSPPLSSKSEKINRTSGKFVYEFNSLPDPRRFPKNFKVAFFKDSLRSTPIPRTCADNHRCILHPFHKLESGQDVNIFFSKSFLSLSFIAVILVFVIGFGRAELKH